MGLASFAKHFMTGQGRDGVATPRPIGPDVSSPQPAPGLEAILRPFLDHSFAPGAIVAVGCRGLWTERDGKPEHATRRADVNEAMLLRLAAAGDGGLAIAERTPMLPAKSGSPLGSPLDSLARQASALTNGSSGDHLLLVAGDVLRHLLPPSTGDFSFKAVVILPSRKLGRSPWKLQRALFDHGLVGIGAVQLAGGEAYCFLTSDAVSSSQRLGAWSRGSVTMTSLGDNGRFANQLFQYAFLKLYALRHGLTAAVPNWQRKELFGFDDPSCEGLVLPELRFLAHISCERELWDAEKPPINVDMWGYFQETPTCWRKHRPLLRRMFQLPSPLESAIDTWRAEVTHGGERALVAVHVRRGDYRDPNGQIWFRMIPDEWYLAWLRAIWPTLRDPLLFVATDEPDVIRPIFNEFETVSATFGGAAQLLPDFLRDFEILRRADYLAICNSTFSRFAAILAPDTQKCFLATFQTRRFVPYEPWLDRDFWARFSV